MTHFPEPILNEPRIPPGENSTRGGVGEGRHSHGDEVDQRAEWLEEQHRRDLETLDRIERQMEERTR